MCAPSKLDCRVIVYCNEMIGVRELFVEQTRKGVLRQQQTRNTQYASIVLQHHLSVRLLVAGTSRRTSVLLGLAATRIYLSIVHSTSTSGNQGAVVFHEDVLDLTLVLFVDV